MSSSQKDPGPSDASRSRRAFIRRALGVGALAPVAGALARGPEASASPAPRPAPDDSARERSARRSQPSPIGGLDHVAVPMRSVGPMISFYRTLGFEVREGERIVSVHFGDQKINFHRPSLWQSDDFTLRAAGAQPPCGDFCWVWRGSREALLERLERAGAGVVAEGERQGGRDGGDAVGRSVYTRDPDGNLLEFIRYR